MESIMIQESKAVMEMLTVETARTWLSLFIEKLKQTKYLNTLDESIGDGGHGANMLRGANDLKAKLAGGRASGRIIRSVQNGGDVFHPENGRGSRTPVWPSLPANVAGYASG